MTEYENTFAYGLGVASFVLGLMNYRENLTQNDKQELMDNSAKIQDAIINKIDNHLQTQDKKIDELNRKLDSLLMPPSNNLQN